jgi:hypothetical protein
MGDNLQSNFHVFTGTIPAADSRMNPKRETRDGTLMPSPSTGRATEVARPLPPTPTIFLPGTAAKVEVMRRRYAAGFAIHHPQDVRYGGCWELLVEQRGACLIPIGQRHEHTGALVLA